MFQTILLSRLEEAGKTPADVAHLLGITPHNLETKLEKDGFTVKEMRIIAAALDYDLKLDLVPREK